MDIPNLSQNQDQIDNSKSSKKKFIPIIIIAVFSIIIGFWVSRFWPSQTSVSLDGSDNGDSAISADSISPNDLQAGVIYGNLEKTFKDVATGTIEKGNINGEGTHILNREGGKSQQASLISSTVDLDLFVDKKVEIKGETNASTRTNWLIDVGSIKIIEE
jgi:hypothetical protein